MKNKNNVLIYCFISFIVGISMGWAVFNNRTHTQSSEGHMMNMEGAMDEMVSGLSGKSGDTFDKSFISEMIEHHAGAVTMAEMALKGAKHQEIKDMASAIIDTQTKEIEQMKKWQSEWYK